MNYFSKNYNRDNNNVCNYDNYTDNSALYYSYIIIDIVKYILYHKETKLHINMQYRINMVLIDITIKEGYYFQIMFL